jgi:beta-galactosidase
MALHLGAAYYPEHWDESHWDQDIRLMQEAGLTVVRMGEFAWAKIEPADNRFCFDWLDRAIERLAASGIQTVLGTPTAAPPAWLIKKHPEILLTEANGHKTFFGNRYHFCANSETYHIYTRRIAEKMGGRYGKHPAVIGWQIDNEYTRVCYCAACRQKFQAFLQTRYQTLDNLNARWTTHYWSQAYDSWDEIELPTDPWNPQNPGLRLEFQRFQTQTYRRYQKIQLDVLRPQIADGVWITHNFMDWFDVYDHYDLAADLDLASWDWYVSQGHNNYVVSAAKHDLVRGYKQGKDGSQSRPYWVMETQPATTSWGDVPNALNPGEARAMAWHAIGHGADAILYWQWRSPLNGQEQYHGTLIDQSGQPRPFYADVKRLGAEFASARETLKDTAINARVAMINSYDSRWSLQYQRFHHKFDYVKHFTHYHWVFAAQNIPVDVISSSADFKNYKLIILPAQHIVDSNLAARLTEYVNNGGHLVLTLRTGVKDDANALLPLRPPGYLADLAGVEVEEFYALEQPVTVIGNWFNGESSIWAERLKIRDEKNTHVIARYGSGNDWLVDHPAITLHPFGRGLVYMVGAYLDTDAQKSFLAHVIQSAEARPVLETPAWIEACRRTTAAGKPIYIVINHDTQTHEVTLPWQARNHLNQTIGETFTLAPYETAVITKA